MHFLMHFKLIRIIWVTFSNKGLYMCQEYNFWAFLLVKKSKQKKQAQISSETQK